MTRGEGLRATQDRARVYGDVQKAGWALKPLYIRHNTYTVVYLKYLPRYILFWMSRTRTRTRGAEKPKLQRSRERCRKEVQLSSIVDTHVRL